MAQSVSSQLLKGFLQGIMLSILSKKANYGYGIAVTLNEVGLGQVPKGTIYPLLATMEKRSLLQSEIRPSEDGPDRKYYFLTEEGMHAKEEFYSQWAMLEQTMNQMIEGD